jgi:hypothetical protein
MKASNFNKGLGPDGFDGSILKPGDASHRLTQDITAQILGLLANPASILFLSTFMRAGWFPCPRTRAKTRRS